MMILLILADMALIAVSAAGYIIVRHKIERRNGNATP